MRQRVLLTAGAIAVLIGLVVLIATLRGGAPDTPAAGASPSSSAPERTVGPSADGAASSSAAPAGPSAWMPPAGAEAKSIVLPAAGIDHDLVPQGLDDNGVINPGRDEVIWFTGYDRVAPGQVGTSVIAGHVNYGAAPDAFTDLVDVEVGDTVELRFAGRHELTATVVSTRMAAKTDLQHDPLVWGQNDSVRRLAIITCDDALGVREDGHRKANFVVIAEIDG